MTKIQEEDLLALVAECNRQDKTNYIFDLNEENLLHYQGDELVCAASIFAPKKDEAEVIFITKKEYRNQGLSANFFKDIEEEIKNRGFKSILLVCDANSDDGLKELLKSDYKYDSSEFLMELSVCKSTVDQNRISVIKAEYKDSEKLVEINMKAFGTKVNDAKNYIDENFSNDLRNLHTINLKGQIIGLIGIYSEVDRLYIHGFCILEEFRNRGFGREALNLTVDMCRDIAINKKVVLEVQTENLNALELYQSCGFDLQTEFRYYRKEI